MPISFTLIILLNSIILYLIIIITFKFSRNSNYNKKDSIIKMYYDDSD